MKRTKQYKTYNGVGKMLGGVGETQRLRENELLHSFIKAEECGEGSGVEEVEEEEQLQEEQVVKAPKAKQSKPKQQAPQQQPTVHFTRNKNEASFLQISREIKAKQAQLAIQLANMANRKRSKRDEEIYTDKDRAAAVNLGTRDIKQSLKMKKKLEKSRGMMIPEDTDSATLLALCHHEIRIGNTYLAITFVNKALDLNAEDKNALVARSQCHLLIGEPHKALADAEAALTLDKTFTKAILQKAESLYHLGDFEYSLVYFHRGLRIRPEMREFKLGVQKAQEAIENVIGDNKIVFPTSPRILKKMFKYVQEKKQSALSKVPQDQSRTNIFNRDKKKKNPAAARRIEKHILGDLYQDKNYLEQLLKNTEALSLKQDFANDDIAQHAQEGIAYLKTRQEFWRQQKSSMPQRKASKPNMRPKTSK